MNGKNEEGIGRVLIIGPIGYSYTLFSLCAKLLGNKLLTIYCSHFVGYTRTRR